MHGGNLRWNMLAVCCMVLARIFSSDCDTKYKNMLPLLELRCAGHEKSTAIALAVLELSFRVVGWPHIGKSPVQQKLEEEIPSMPAALARLIDGYTRETPWLCFQEALSCPQRPLDYSGLMAQIQKSGTAIQYEKDTWVHGGRTYGLTIVQNRFLLPSYINDPVVSKMCFFLDSLQDAINAGVILSSPSSVILKGQYIRGRDDKPYSEPSDWPGYGGLKSVLQVAQESCSDDFLQINPDDAPRLLIYMVPHAFKYYSMSFQELINGVRYELLAAVVRQHKEENPHHMIITPSHNKVDNFQAWKMDDRTGLSQDGFAERDVLGVRHFSQSSLTGIPEYYNSHVLIYRKCQK